MKVKKSLLLIMVIVLGVCFYSDNKTIITTSYMNYKEGNNNLVLNKILSDNELKEEIPNMFNYSTNGLYSNQDEDGTTYYYRGDIDNNNIQFGEYQEDYYVYGTHYQSVVSCEEDGNSICTPVKLASKGDKMYWKIIRVNGDGSLRLLYNGTSTNPDNSDLANSYVIGLNDYASSYRDPKYTAYTYDRDTNETDSFIKKEVDTWYENTLGKTSTYDDMVVVGRFCSDSSGYDGYYFASNKRLNGDNITPTFICSETDETYGGSYRLKAGLIEADELVFGGDGYEPGDSYLSTGDTGYSYWTMTPAVYDPAGAGPYVYYHGLRVTGNDAMTPSGIRPVINVSTENMALIGDGTALNPYIIGELSELSNTYKGTISIGVGSNSDIVNAFENIELSNDIEWKVEDESIVRIEDNKIIGLKEGVTRITGVSSDGLSTYEIEVTVINNPITNSMLYISIGMILILILGTVIYVVYKRRADE